MTEDLIVTPGEPAALADRDPGSKLGLDDKEEGQKRVSKLTHRLRDLHSRLWAAEEQAMVVVLQGMDTSGKDGAIKKVFRGLDPQGFRVTGFKAPGGEELEHDYLWRVHAVCPRLGTVAVFNRSHYEDVVAARVRKLVERDWGRRFQHIREFERMLTDEGTAVVKVFLHISLEEQRERLQARLDRPDKRWKFRTGDLEDRALWDDFAAAYEEAITETSTPWAPWYVVPADRKWVRDVGVAEIVLDAMERLDPQYPAPDPGLDDLVIT
jgi:PPK2 family polyphosphate:nucleotide phosphotransferase